MSRVMKDSGHAWLGKIPKDWDTISIKLAFHKRSQKNNPIVSKERLSLSIDKGITLYADKTTNLDRFKDDFTQYQIAYPNDIVLNSMNMIVGAIGLSQYFGCVSPVYYVIYPQNDTISVHFYSYLLNVTSIKDLYRSLGKGIYAIDRGDGRVNTCRLKVSYTDFGKIEIPHPTLQEQQAIANFLDIKCTEIDELIALQEQMIEELKLYKQSVITEAVTKGLNPNVAMKDSGIEWIGEIPEHWEVWKLKWIFTFITGSTPKDFENTNQNEAKNISWFTPGDISDDGCELYTSQRVLSEEIIINNNIKLFPKNSLIYVGIGATAGKIGFSHIEAYSNQQITALITKETNNNAKYFYYYLLADKIRIRDNAFYTTIPILNSSYLSQLNVPNPPLLQQQKIADYLDKKCAKIDELTSIKQQKIDELKEYKKSIIYEYVTGKKQVNLN